MHDMALAKRHGFHFSVAHACDFLWFKENLYIGDNYKGKDHAELEPWDIWVHSDVYGFRDIETHDRWIDTVYLELPRKHNKTGSAGAVAFFDAGYAGIKAPLIQIGAGSQEQAKKLFTPMTQVIDNEPDLTKDLKLSYTNKRIDFGVNGGWLEIIATVAKNQDGANPSTVILDELHAQKADVFQVLTSAFGSRRNQMLYQITTAGRFASGLAWDQRNAAMRVLESKSGNWNTFAAIFTLDPQDVENRARLLSDKRLWYKAMPMLGVSVKMSQIEREAEESKNSPTKREEFYRTRLNLWSNAATALVDMDQWSLCANPKLTIEDFIDTDVPCYLGLDVSVYLDLTGLAALFGPLPESWKPHAGKFALFVKGYLPDSSPTFLNPINHAIFREFAEQGLLELHSRGQVDQRRIETDIRAYCEVFNVRQIGADPNRVNELLMRLWEDDYPVLKVQQSARELTNPTEDLLGHIHTQNLMHDGGGLLTWCTGNVVGERRVDGSVLPKKVDQHSELKIDLFSAAVNANAVRINAEFLERMEDKPAKDPYAERGIIGAKEDEREQH